MLTGKSKLNGWEILLNITIFLMNGKPFEIFVINQDLKSSRFQARLWVQIMKELRRGVRLKAVEHTTVTPTEYELTPFEIILEDIRSRRYTLNKVMVCHSLSATKIVHVFHSMNA